MTHHKTYCVNCFVVMAQALDYCPRCTYPQPLDNNHLYLHPPYRLYHQYVIGRVLGHGSFGITYLAYDRNLGVKAAIKEYFPAEFAMRNHENQHVVSLEGQKRELFLNGKKKFIAEARLLSALRSPYIVRIRHFFETNHTAYFVMEYLEGQTLNAYLSGHGGKIAFEQLRPILLALLDALEEVHSHNNYHRDIKPDNVYMTLNNHPMLLDFGSARQEAATSTQTISLLTPGFAPIEQYSSHGLQGPWTDIYGVAATAFYALTGQIPPYPQDRLTEDAQLLPPSQLGAELRPEDEEWLLKGLALRWNDRPSSVAEWRRQLPPPPEASVAQRPFSNADENFIRFAILPKLASRFLTPEDEAEIYESATFLDISREQTTKLIEQALQMTGSVRRDPAKEQQDAAARKAELEARLRKSADSESAVTNLTFSEVFQPQKPLLDLKELPQSLSNSVGMQFRLITPFSSGAGFRIPRPFAMGDGKKQHSVTLSRRYYLQRSPVTRAQWRMITGKDPAFFQDHDDAPVEQVSWHDCQEFIRRLNLLREGHYRLPTEAEWEFACRGNQQGAFYFGSDLKQLPLHAWYQENAGTESHPIEKLAPNPFGLYDLYGNVWEWVQDYAGDPPVGHQTDPQGPLSGSEKILRGGSWMSEAEECSNYSRWRQPPDTSSFQIGFRVLLEIEDQ